MAKHPRLDGPWAEREKLRTHADRLRLEANGLLRAAGDQSDEAHRIYADAVLSAYGPHAVIDWTDGSVEVDDSPPPCTLAEALAKWVLVTRPSLRHRSFFLDRAHPGASVSVESAIATDWEEYKP